MIVSDSMEMATDSRLPLVLAEELLLEEALQAVAVAEMAHLMEAAVVAALGVQMDYNPKALHHQGVMLYLPEARQEMVAVVAAAESLQHLLQMTLMDKLAPVALAVVVAAVLVPALLMQLTL